MRLTFRNENGNPVTPPIFIPTNGYANLYIKSVLQMNAILSFTSSTTTGSVVITQYLDHQIPLS
ncbi:hypothetical protein [Bacillus cereus]|uniref:hypothetical protein n=1 Tax=Bacillus cereus TaxID=1396 RepID=UPI0021B3A6DD|nr:hypothetical protein [Bacillus cereus]